MKDSTIEKHQLKTEKSVEFILSGNAHVTFKNNQTQNRYTYHVVKSKSDKPVHFVSVLFDGNNENDYTYIGCIFDEKHFKITSKSNVKSDDIRFKVFAYVFEHLLKGDLNSAIEIWHEGRCGRCGRLLTVPESISTGFGSECASIMGLNYKLIKK